MIPLTDLQVSNGANYRHGNNVHRRMVRDLNPQRLAFAYGHECLMQALSNISQTPLPLPTYTVTAEDTQTIIAHFANSRTI